MSRLAWVLQTDGDQSPAPPLFLSPCSAWSAIGYLNFNITISNIMSLLKIRVCSFFLFIYNFASAERPAPSTEDIQTYQELRAAYSVFLIYINTLTGHIFLFVYP